MSFGRAPNNVRGSVDVSAGRNQQVPGQNRHLQSQVNIESDKDALLGLQSNNNFMSSLVDNQIEHSDLNSTNLNSQGFDVLRLSNPQVDNLNEDFICGICHKIVNFPKEC